MAIEDPDKSTDIDDNFAENMLEKLTKLPAQYSRETYEEIEARVESSRVTRRLALLMLTKPFTELRDSVVADRSLAIAMVDLYNGMESTLDMMRGVIEAMETSRIWQMMSLACREDMISLFEEAKIKQSEHTKETT